MTSRVCVVIVVCGFFLGVGAVDGISVSINNGPTVHTYYGRIDGELWRCAIKDDIVTECEKIFDGQSQPGQY